MKTVMKQRDIIDMLQTLVAIINHKQDEEDKVFLNNDGNEKNKDLNIRSIGNKRSKSTNNKYKDTKLNNIRKLLGSPPEKNKLLKKTSEKKVKEKRPSVSRKYLLNSKPRAHSPRKLHLKDRKAICHSDIAVQTSLALLLDDTDFREKLEEFLPNHENRVIKSVYFNVWANKWYKISSSNVRKVIRQNITLKPAESQTSQNNDIVEVKKIEKVYDRVENKRQKPTKVLAKKRMKKPLSTSKDKRPSSAKGYLGRAPMFRERPPLFEDPSRYGRRSRASSSKKSSKSHKSSPRKANVATSPSNKSNDMDNVIRLSNENVPKLRIPIIGQIYVENYESDDSYRRPLEAPRNANRHNNSLAEENKKGSRYDISETDIDDEDKKQTRSESDIDALDANTKLNTSLSRYNEILIERHAERLKNNEVLLRESSNTDDGSKAEVNVSQNKDDTLSNKEKVLKEEDEGAIVEDKTEVNMEQSKVSEPNLSINQSSKNGSLTLDLVNATLDEALTEKDDYSTNIGLIAKNGGSLQLNNSIDKTLSADSIDQVKYPNFRQSVNFGAEGINPTANSAMRQSIVGSINSVIKQQQHVEKEYDVLRTEVQSSQFSKDNFSDFNNEISKQVQNNSDSQPSNIELGFLNNSSNSNKPYTLSFAESETSTLLKQDLNPKEELDISNLEKNRIRIEGGLSLYIVEGINLFISPVKKLSTFYKYGPELTRINSINSVIDQLYDGISLEELKVLCDKLMSLRDNKKEDIELDRTIYNINFRAAILGDSSSILRIVNRYFSDSTELCKDNVTFQNGFDPTKLDFTNCTLKIMLKDSTYNEKDLSYQFKSDLYTLSKSLASESKQEKPSLSSENIIPLIMKDGVMPLQYVPTFQFDDDDIGRVTGDNDVNDDQAINIADIDGGMDPMDKHDSMVIGDDDDTDSEQVINIPDIDDDDINDEKAINIANINGDDKNNNNINEDQVINIISIDDDDDLFVDEKLAPHNTNKGFETTTMKGEIEHSRPSKTEERLNESKESTLHITLSADDNVVDNTKDNEIEDGSVDIQDDESSFNVGIDTDTNLSLTNTSGQNDGTEDDIVLHISD